MNIEELLRRMVFRNWKWQRIEEIVSAGGTVEWNLGLHGIWIQWQKDI